MRPSVLSPLLAILLGLSPLPPQSGWRPPVALPAHLLNQFRTPNSDYSAGHRGVDYLVEGGQSVLAPAAGNIAFVGFVANKPLLAIQHSDNLRTAFEPVCSALQVGTSVRAGQVIGTVCPAGYASHCAPLACLHFSLRRQDQYLSPLVYLGGISPSVLIWPN